MVNRKNRKIKNLFNRTIALILVCVMVFNLCPSIIIALNDVKQEDEISESPTRMIKENEREPEIIGEDIEKRTLNEKHFLLDDGTMIAAVYPDNIHYEKDGKLEDIDNTLKEVKNSKNEAEYKNTANAFEVSFAKTVTMEKIAKLNMNGFEIKWSLEGISEFKKEELKSDILENEQPEKTEIETKLDSNVIEEIKEIEDTTGINILEDLGIKEESADVFKETEKNKEKVDENIPEKSEKKEDILDIKDKTKTTEEGKEKTINSVEARIVKNEDIKVAKNSNEEKVALKNIVSNIEYSNIIENIDLKYDVISSRIKESIVLNNRKAIQGSFAFIFDVGTLTAELTEDNEVIIYNKNKEDIIYVIETPYMFDSNEQYSDNIEIKLEEITENNDDNKQYRLTIIPNREWLEDEARTYPVTIDPTVQTSLEPGNIEDTHIYEGDTNVGNRHLADRIRVGNNNDTQVTNKKPMRGMIKFVLPDVIKAGDQIIEAQLSLFTYPKLYDVWTPTTRLIRINAHKITKNWLQTAANWNNMSAYYDSKVEDYIHYLYEYNNEYKRYDFNITSIVKEWYTTGNNYGIMLKEEYEESNYSANNAYFLSAEAHPVYYFGRPSVTIFYINQTGLEDYLSYHVQDIGRAGTVYTNDYNGNLTLIHQDASTPGTRMPVSISHIYNTHEKDNDHTIHWCGKGFRLNINQTIEMVNIYTHNATVEYAKYIDEDGTAHYFKKKAGSSTVYEDEEGLGLTLTLASNVFTMEDKAGNKSTFERRTIKGKYLWHLKEIEDTNGNKTTLYFHEPEPNTFTITKIVDGAGQEIQFKYSGAYLTKIIDSAGRETQYLYNSNGNLTQITYPDGKYSRYTYNDNKIVWVIDTDNYLMEYFYYAEKTSRVKAIKEYSTIDTLGNSLNIIYGNNATTFTDNKGYKNTITFDNLGRATSIADFGKEAENINNAYGKAYKYGNDGRAKNKLTLETKLISVRDMPNNLMQNGTFDSGLTGWQGSQCTSDDTVTMLNNNNVLRIIGNPDLLKYMRQNISVSGAKGDIFNISAWVKNKGVSNLYMRSSRITIRIVGINNETQWVDMEINRDTNEWQFFSEEFITDHAYKSIEVYLIYYENSNEILFDNIGLFKEDFGQSYKYDEKGNIISTQDLAKKSSTFEYNGKNELIKSVNPKGGSFVYNYDNNHKNRILKATNTTGLQYNFTYDQFGNATNVKIQNTNTPTVTITPTNTTTIENGATYRIKSQYTGYYLQNIDSQVRSKTGSSDIAQEWIVWKRSDGGIKLESKSEPGKVMYVTTVGSEELLYVEPVEGRDYTIPQEFYPVSMSDGTFLLNTGISNKQKTMHIPSSAEGARVMQWATHTGNNQRFYFEKVADSAVQTTLEDGATYKIMSQYTNYYLQNMNFQIRSKRVSTDVTQEWVVRKQNNGSIKLESKSDVGEVMFVDTVNGEEQIWLEPMESRVHSTRQEFYPTLMNDGSFLLKAGISNQQKTMHVASSVEEVRTILWAVNPWAAQQFYFVKVADSPIETDLEDGETYKIRSQYSGYYLQNLNSEVCSKRNSTDMAQEWIVRKQSNATIKLESKADPGKVMYMGDVVNNEELVYVEPIDSGVNSARQEFYLVPKNNGSFSLNTEISNRQQAMHVYSNYEGANTLQLPIVDWSPQNFYFEKVTQPIDNGYIKTSASYTSNGNYLTKLTDQKGNETNYQYNQTTGTLTKLIDAKQNETNYTYDNMDRLSTVAKTVGPQTYQNSYTYENDRLKTITHNGFSYNFIYDNFGNTNQVKVGGQALITNNYEANNGNLTSAVYGNNQTISYLYDRFNRITKKTGTDGSHEYTYDAKSNLGTYKDNVNNETTTYTYDLAERLVQSSNTNGFKTQYGYDENSNVNSTKYTLNSIINEMKYTFDKDNRIKNVKLDDSTYITTNYDGLSRVNNKELKVGTDTYTTEYTYEDIDENKTTTSLKSIKNETNDEISYTYDVLGNIETISEGSTLKAKYYYDELSQLIREDNVGLNKTITYSYDLGGNITDKKEYEYTTDDLTNLTTTNTISYSYTNTNWKDQLTSYNNIPITYDAIGNPLTYNGNTYTWQNGRQLASIANGINTYTYKYNDSGIRTSKTVNGVETKFFLER